MSTILIPDPDPPLFQVDNPDATDGGQIISADLTVDTDDEFVGSEGSDLILTLGGDDAVLAGAGDDSLVLGEGNDLGVGGLGDDTLDGGIGDDRVFGGLGDDIVIGGTGDDTLSGGLGDDTLDGGEGADSFVLGADTGVDTIIGFNPGEDQIVFEGIDPDAVDVTYDPATGSLSIDGEEIAILDLGLDIDEEDFTFM